MAKDSKSDSDELRTPTPLFLVMTVATFSRTALIT